MPQYLDYETHRVVELEADERGRDTVHIFDARDVDAINGALATARPLLIKGEPGTGKSQLARAAAKALGFEFTRLAVSAATEPEGLLYEFDAVERLAEAQLIQATAGMELAGKTSDQRRAWIQDQLAIGRFLRPGPLWRGFDWASAERRDDGELIGEQATQTRAAIPVVVLIDEIDKADPAVPNSLLDALGRGAFVLPDRTRTVIRSHAKAPPLVVVTSNDERAIPAAFLRRCLVLHLVLPEDETAFRTLLTDRAIAHLERGNCLPKESDMTEAQKVLDEAAGLLWKDRIAARQARLPPPGQAEFLDLAWALFKLGRSAEHRHSLMNRMREFTFDKHRLQKGEPDGNAGAS